MKERGPSSENPDSRPPEPAESRKENEPKSLRRSFEYRDSEDRLLGRAEVELDPEPTVLTDRNLKIRGHYMLGCILHGEKDGKPTRLDLLTLANRHHNDILMTDMRLSNYFYLEAQRVAVIPPLETPTDLGVCLHELGHASQHRDDRFKDVTPLYKKDFADEVGDFDAVVQSLGSTLAFSGEAEQLLRDEGMAEIADAMKPFRAAKETFAVAEKRREERMKTIETEEDRQRALEEYDVASVAMGAADSAVSQAVARATSGHVNTFRILRLPTLIMERDATARALSWLREIKRTAGIDLLGARRTKLPEPQNAGECEVSVTTAFAMPNVELLDPHDSLTRALKTHNAEIPLGRVLKGVNRDLDADARRIESTKRIIASHGSESQKKIIDAEHDALTMQDVAEDLRQEIIETHGVDPDGKGILNKFRALKLLWKTRKEGPDGLLMRWTEAIHAGRKYEKTSDALFAASEQKKRKTRS